MANNNYVDNEEFLTELQKYFDSGKSKEDRKMSLKLQKMIMEICKQLTRHKRWNRYTWKDDLISEGAMTAMNYGVPNYNMSRKNPHAYFTMIIWRAFYQYCEKENKHCKIKKEIVNNSSWFESLYEGKNDLSEKAVDYSDLKAEQEKK